MKSNAEQAPGENLVRQGERGWSGPVPVPPRRAFSSVQKKRTPFEDRRSSRSPHAGCSSRRADSGSSRGRRRSPDLNREPPKGQALNPPRATPGGAGGDSRLAQYQVMRLRHEKTRGGRKLLKLTSSFPSRHDDSRGEGLFVFSRHARLPLPPPRPAPPRGLRSGGGRAITGRNGASLW